MTKSIKSTGELRRFLIDQMTSVAEGTLEANKAKAITNIAQQVYNTVNLEIKMALAMDKLGDTPVGVVKFNE